MPETPDVRIQLAAYLAGELDDAAVEALEARMQSEPWVADAADDMADMLVELGAVEEVDPPVGFADRLRAGLAAEIGHELPRAARLDPDVVRASGAAALDGWSTTSRGRRDRPTGSRPGDQHRAETRRSRFGRAAMAVAAGVVVLFVGTTAVFLSSSSDDSGDSVESADDTSARAMGDEAAFAGGAADSAEEEREEAAMEMAPDMLQEPTALDAPLAAEEAPVEDAEEEAAEETAADEAAADGELADTDTGDAAGATTAAPVGPALLDLGEIGGDDDAVRATVGGDPAATQLIGRSEADAEQLATPFRDEILRAEPFDDGVEPGACLTEVLRDADGVVVPAVAASFTADGDPRLGYALVRSSSGDALDRIDVWVVDPGGCSVLAVVS